MPAFAVHRLSNIPPIEYERDLFQERTIRSVTAITRQDGRDFLDLAARHRFRVEVTAYAMKQAPDALADLAARSCDRSGGPAALTSPTRITVADPGP